MIDSGASPRTPLWDFCLDVYGQTDVEQECLALQERFGVDVNLLLFAAYAGAVEGIALSESETAEASETIADWHGDVVRSLRKARQALKASSRRIASELAGPAEALRAAVKTAELESERIELSLLSAWLSAGVRERSDREEALRANVARLLARYGADIEDARSILRAAISAASKKQATARPGGSAG